MANQFIQLDLGGVAVTDLKVGLSNDSDHTGIKMK